MKIETIGILGAGAVGSYFLWGLQEKFGKNLWAIAEGERKERLESHGIFVNGERVRLFTKSPLEAKDVDLLIVATKYQGLLEATDSICNIVGPNTVVISALNGVDSEEILSDMVGEEHLLYGLMQIASQRRGNSISFPYSDRYGLYFGEKDGSESDRVSAVINAFEGTNCHVFPRKNIQEEIWYKYVYNITNNIPQAILSMPHGFVSSDQHALVIKKLLRQEVVLIARACGIDISEKSPLERNTSAAPWEARYSTLQDLDAGRKTEIEMFCGTVVRLGEKYGIPTPYNAFAREIVCSLEDKNMIENK